DDGRLPDQTFLKKLAERTSLDFAALIFARALTSGSRSRSVQAAFDRFLQEGPDRAGEALRRPGAFPYPVLFAPSWVYKSHPENGADFARQRRILESLGIGNGLVESGESDSVEDNAAVIGRAIGARGCAGGRIVLVSANKSGAEAAMALSALTAQEAACVAAWINLAGALRGTPLADSALRAPVRWMARGIFWLSGWRWDALESLETERSRRRLETLRLPESVLVLNVVAVPVSGSVGYQVSAGVSGAQRPRSQRRSRAGRGQRVARRRQHRRPRRRPPLRALARARLHPRDAPCSRRRHPRLQPQSGPDCHRLRNRSRSDRPDVSRRRSRRRDRRLLTARRTAARPTTRPEARP